MNRVLKLEHIVEATGLCSTTIWKLEKQGQFPKRVKLSPNRVGWRETDLDEWVQIGYEAWGEKTTSLVAAESANSPS